MKPGSAIRSVLGNFGLAAVYLVFGKLGLSLAFLNASASAVWPPTGIALAALIIWGWRLSPGVFLGAFLVNITTQGSVATSLGVGLGNTLEALAGAFLVCRLARGYNAFERTTTFFGYAFWAGIFSTSLSPTIGVTSICLGGFGRWDQFGAVWLTWWLGDMVSNFIIAPLILVWFAHGYPRIGPKRALEGLGMLVIVLVVGQIVFLHQKPSDAPSYPITYLALLPALWGAFRLRERGAVTASFIMAAIALWGTLRGLGPFVRDDSNESLLFLQAFVGTMAVTALALASAVSERFRAEEQARLQSVALESAANAIVITNRQGAIEWVNSAFCNLTGYIAGEVLGQNPRILKSGGHDAQFYRSLWETVLEGRVWHGEIINKRKDGSLYIEEMTITPVLGKRGTNTHFIAIKQDVTHRKEAERALQEAQEILARTNASLEELVDQRTAMLREMVAELEHFSYSIVHDMRAPLRGIQSFAGLIEEESGHTLTPDAKGYLSRIRRAANRMDQLITDALSYSKAVRTELPARPVDVALLLRGMLESYPEFAASHAFINLEGDFPNVMGNEAGLTQCFSNLLHNAIKFVQPGQKPKIRIWAQPFPEIVRIWVEDNGVGIPKHSLQKMFAMFQRMHGAEFEGTGIGLALVRKVTERMGGRVGVESEVGQGSRFWIELPAANQADPQ